MPDHELTPPPLRNLWASISFWLGMIAVVFSFTLFFPFPTISFTTCPGGIAAMLSGWIGLRVANNRKQPQSARTARWGIGLGCAGYVVLVLQVLAVGGLLIWALVFGVDVLGGLSMPDWLSGLFQ